MLRVATYNIHKCRGMDRRIDPERIAEVLLKLDAEVIALQEVVRHAGKENDQAQFLADALGYNLAFGETRSLRTARNTHAPYGNAILSRFPITDAKFYDITAGIREPRGCMRADVLLPDVQSKKPAQKSRSLHIFNVHLGTGFLERRKQGRILVSEKVLNNPEYIGSRLLLGDFNEWTTGLATELLRSHMTSVDISKFAKCPRSYPGMFPLVHLDHIYFDPAFELKHFAIISNKLTRMASDHLPLVADFELHGPAARDKAVDFET